LSGRRVFQVHLDKYRTYLPYLAGNPTICHCFQHHKTNSGLERNRVILELHVITTEPLILLILFFFPSLLFALSPRDMATPIFAECAIAFVSSSSLTLKVIAEVLGAADL
jgi:hypothetical protein